jgi:hypothetical protein
VSAHSGVAEVHWQAMLCHRGCSTCFLSAMHLLLSKRLSHTICHAERRAGPNACETLTAQATTSAEGEVLTALSRIIDPDFGEDIVACGFVRDLATGGHRTSCGSLFLSRHASMCVFSYHNRCSVVLFRLRRFPWTHRPSHRQRSLQAAADDARVPRQSGI